MASGDAPGPLWPGDEPAPEVPIASVPPPMPRAAAQPAPVTGGLMPRNAWTTVRPVASRANPMSVVRRITIHHSAIPSAGMRSTGDTAKMLRRIQQEHMSRRSEPFADIGYHYAIDPSGRVWEGRPLNLQGAHVSDNNENNLGIVVLGNFEREQPTPAALAALDSFVCQQMRRYGVPIQKVYTHRELGKTACPGRNLQSYMVRTRGGSGRMRQG